MTNEEWFDKGSFIQVNQYQVFVIDSQTWDCQDRGELSKKATLCILHGFPTSSYDYHKVIDRLSQSYRVIVHDHLGFGFSDKPKDYSYSLIDQTIIALTLWNQLGVSSAQILGHDYGTSMVTELLARDNESTCPVTLQKIILCNGSMHIEMAKLRTMQKLLRTKFIGGLVARLSNKKLLAKNLRDIYVDPSQLKDDEIDSIWEMMMFNHGKRVLAKISRYTFERKLRWNRWIGALQESEQKIEIIWPDSDPIAVASMARVIFRETKNSNLHWLEGVGHFPMLEQPEHWCSLVLECLD
jgi:pimeloyl-ACP methyl ester carboxylesterase